MCLTHMGARTTWSKPTCYVLKNTFQKIQFQRRPRSHPHISKGGGGGEHRAHVSHSTRGHTTAENHLIRFGMRASQDTQRPDLSERWGKKKQTPLHTSTRRSKTIWYVLERRLPGTLNVPSISLGKKEKKKLTPFFSLHAGTRRSKTTWYALKCRVSESLKVPSISNKTPFSLAGNFLVAEEGGVGSGGVLVACRDLFCPWVCVRVRVRERARAGESARERGERERERERERGKRRRAKERESKRERGRGERERGRVRDIDKTETERERESVCVWERETCSAPRRIVFGNLWRRWGIERGRGSDLHTGEPEISQRYSKIVVYPHRDIAELHSTHAYMYVVVLLSWID